MKTSQGELQLAGPQLGFALRKRRKDLGLTQLELADLAGVSSRFIHDLENGKPSVQLDRVLAVATTLGLELDWRIRKPDSEEEPKA